MRSIESSLPSKEETVFETEKRLRIVKGLLPELEKIAEVVILVGSTANGKNYSVRKESDVDILVLINRKDSKKITSSELFKKTPRLTEQLDLFDKKEIDHFTINKIIDNVKVQFHFWDKEVHFKVEFFEKMDPKIYSNDKEFTDIFGTDFLGMKRNYVPPKIKKVKYGLVYDYPPYFIAEEHFVPRVPLTNLITCPEILFTKDKKIYDNIEKIWKNIVKRFLEESKNGSDPNMSIINCIYGNWNLSPDSRKKIESKIKEVLENVKRA